MSRSKKWAVLVLALVLVVAAAGFLVHRARSGGNVGATYLGQKGAPTSQGASYVVDFATADPAAVAGSVDAVTWGSLTAAPGVVQGVLTQGASATPTSASYFFHDNGSAPRRIGVEVRWPDNPGGGDPRAVAMLISEGTLPQVPTGVRPNVPVHFVITEDSWQLGVFPAAGQLSLIAQHKFHSHDFAGPLRFEVQLDGSTVTVVQPDGKAYAVTSPRFAQYEPRWVGWELFQAKPGVASPGIASWWSN